MVSARDFAHEVWVSLENIRERLAVLEAEVRHTRSDLLRLETVLASHISDHQHGGDGGDHDGHGNGRHDNNAGITVKINRKLLGMSGGMLAVFVGAGKVLGWW